MATKPYVYRVLLGRNQDAEEVCECGWDAVEPLAGVCSTCYGLREERLKSDRRSRQYNVENLLSNKIRTVAGYRSDRGGLCEIVRNGTPQDAF